MLNRRDFRKRLAGAGLAAGVVAALPGALTGLARNSGPLLMREAATPWLLRFCILHRHAHPAGTGGRQRLRHVLPEDRFLDRMGQTHYSFQHKGYVFVVLDSIEPTKDRLWEARKTAQPFPSCPLYVLSKRRRQGRSLEIGSEPGR